MENDLLDDVRRFFRMLGIDLQWDDYSKFVDYAFFKDKKKYCDSLDDGFTFLNDTK